MASLAPKNQFSGGGWWYHPPLKMVVIFRDGWCHPQSLEMHFPKRVNYYNSSTIFVWVDYILIRPRKNRMSLQIIFVVLSIYIIYIALSNRQGEASCHSFITYSDKENLHCQFHCEFYFFSRCCKLQ